MAIEFVPSRVEVEIGHTLDLPLAIYGYLPDCELINLPDCELILSNIY